MELTKVYVLTCEYELDCSGGGVEVRVFDTLSFAQEQMIADASCWYDDNEREVDEWEHIESDMSIEYYEEGYYMSNHIRWFIVEKEIEFDPERQYDRNGDVLNVGDRVLWYDPAEEFRDLQRVYKIFEIGGDIIRISDERSEVECFASELELYKP